MFIVYVIYNQERNKIYIGQTVDLEKRLARHNNTLKSKETSFTRINSGKWELVYKEEYNTRSETLKREKELKSFKGRQYINNILGR